MAEIVALLLIIIVWGLHNNLLKLVDYLLDKIVMIGMGTITFLRIGRVCRSLL